MAGSVEKGADSPASEDVGRELVRIEAAISGGEADLAALGFWRVVGRVKRDPVLVERYADVVGRIDLAAFEARVRLRSPVWLGNAALLAGALFGAAAALVGLRAANPTVAGLALLVAAVTWIATLHCPAHWAVGRLAGIRFKWYFLGGPPPPRPGLKTDYATYLRAEPMKRAWMHASGALVSKAVPFATLAFWPGSAAPGWAAWALVGIGLFTIATDVLFSTKSSDWKKVIRERAVARARAGGV